MYIIDTNIFKHVASGSQQAYIRNIQKWWKEQDAATIYTSVATIMEQRRGLEKLRRSNPQEATRLEQQLQGLVQRLGDRILNIDLDTAHVWGVMDQMERKADIDGAIAATARLRGFYVVTRNEKDFKKRNVRVLNPSSTEPKIIEP